MTKKYLSLILLALFSPAFGGQLATIEYVHNSISANTGITVPYNANATDLQAPANTTYLLTAIDAMNQQGAYSTPTNLRASSYATTRAVDVTGVDWAAKNLLNCNVAGRYTNNGECLLCPSFAYCPVGSSNFISCDTVCDGCATEILGASLPSQCVNAGGRTIDLTTPTYFDTGIDNQGDWKIESKYQMSDYLPSIGRQVSALFCARNMPSSTSQYGFCYFLMAASQNGRADCGTATTAMPHWDTNVHTIIMGREEGVILDGVVKRPDSCTITQGYPINFIIGAITSDGMTENLGYAPFYGKIFYFKIWKNDLLVRNFVPIYAGESINGITATENAMFDMVSNTVFYNQAN
ncbi:MAG: hypothetical protein LBO08_01085 [Rickettsiales bacterium]|jgi:hypothetical protein|nr:hypothetical protein [Rickettsiales bacterium]